MSDALRKIEQSGWGEPSGDLGRDSELTSGRLLAAASRQHRNLLSNTKKIDVTEVRRVNNGSKVVCCVECISRVGKLVSFSSRGGGTII